MVHQGSHVRPSVAQASAGWSRWIQPASGRLNLSCAGIVLHRAAQSLPAAPGRAIYPIPRRRPAEGHAPHPACRCHNPAGDRTHLPLAAHAAAEKRAGISASPARAQQLSGAPRCASIPEALATNQIRRVRRCIARPAACISAHGANSFPDMPTVAVGKLTPPLRAYADHRRLPPMRSLAL